MSTVRKTISLLEAQDAWIKAQVATGRFASESEVHRVLISEMMDADRKKTTILDHIRSGRESGYTDASFDEIIARGQARAQDIIETRQKGAA